MSFFKGFLLLMTLVDTNGDIQHNWRPVGPLLCAEMCKEYSQCKNMTFISDLLFCQLFDNKVLGTCFHSKKFQHQRYLLTRRGVLVNLDIRFKCGISDSEVCKKCDLHTSEAIVVSASKSMTCPHIVYFLMKWKRKRALISFNMLTNHYLIINCYKEDYKSRQLFLGSCTNNRSGSCLYKLKISSKLQVIAYKEDTVDDVPLIIGDSVLIKHHYGCPAACSVGQTNVFHCMIEGKLETIDLAVKKKMPSIFLPTYTGQGRIRDIAVDTDFSCVVLIHNRQVTLAALNLSNMTLATVNVLKVNIQTVTRNKTTFMFHDGEFDIPFAYCSMGDLVSGSCASKIKSLYL